MRIADALLGSVKFHPKRFGDHSMQGSAPPLPLPLVPNRKLGASFDRSPHRDTTQDPRSDNMNVATPWRETLWEVTVIRVSGLGRNTSKGAPGDGSALPAH